MNQLLTVVDILAISPMLILLTGLVLVLLVESFSKAPKRYVFPLTVATLSIALIASFYAPVSDHALLTHWIRFDPPGEFFTRFFIFIGLGTAFLASSFFRQVKTSEGEYYFLLLSSLIGLILIGIAADFLTLFIGLETLSISLYILCGYIKGWKLSHEAAIKYFLIGALAAAILLYGIALIYGAIGTTRFALMLEGYKHISTTAHTTLFLSGIALVTAGLAFKAAIVPFHAWAPDVYAGSPTPVTAFMSTGTKVGAFAAFIIVFTIALPNFHPLWNQCVALLAYPTIVFANIVALRQTHLRRFFAYSGISHAGFLLIPLASGGPDALSSLLFYLVVYATATFGAFATITFLDHHEGEDISIKSLTGLFYRSPFLGCIMGICLLTLAGLPPTAGFLAKFYIFKVAFEADNYALVIVGLLMSVLSVFYYTRIVGLIFSKENGERESLSPLWMTSTVAIAALFGVIALSVNPEMILMAIQFINRRN